MSSRVIVALDGMSREQSLQMARSLRGRVWGYKVNDLLIESGVDVIRELAELGGVFADPKLY
ncbi:MAG: hypothetical protein KDD69_19010, partial [Bdellovibrionales bacterium]|nr:hypothetical protein [Bdellovibrionales bacterium]